MDKVDKNSGNREKHYIERIDIFVRIEIKKVNFYMISGIFKLATSISMFE